MVRAAERFLGRQPRLMAFGMRRVFGLRQGRMRQRLLEWSIRRSYRAYSRGDHEVSFALIHPDVEWRLPPLGIPDAPETLHGRDAVLDWYGRVWDEWDHDDEPVEVRDLGDGVVEVRALNRLHSKMTGLDMELDDVDVFEFENGWIVRVTEHVDESSRSPWRGVLGGRSGA